MNISLWSLVYILQKHYDMYYNIGFILQPFSVWYLENLHDFFQGCWQTTYLMVLTLPASAALAQRQAWVSASHHSRMPPATTVITCSMLSAKVCVWGVVGGGVGGGLICTSVM